MQAFKCTNDLCCIEPSPFLWKFDFFPKVPKEFTSIEEIQDKIQLIIRLKGIVKVDDKRILDLFQNFSFGFSLNSEISGCDLLLLENFHSVHLISFFLPN